MPTTFTKCKVDAQGRQYDCTTSKGETCTVISGPGSGTGKAQTRSQTGRSVLGTGGKKPNLLNQAPKAGTASPN